MNNSKVSPLQQIQNFFKKLITTSLLIGIPVGVIYILNLPYPAIRRPVSQKMPLLLLPSQISTEYHFKKSVMLLEEAQQLIDNATSMNDLLLGEQKLQEAKTSLNAIPVNFTSDLFGGASPRYGYGWAYSPLGYQNLRGKVGQLEAKVFQEKNAQTLLTQADSIFNQIKTQVENKENTEKTIANWEEIINQLGEIPSSTLAGEQAQQKINNYQRQLEKIVGYQINTQELNTFVASAQQFSKQAVELGQNPPHSAQKWAQIEEFWQLAINELEKVSQDNNIGYVKAQQLIAEYKKNLAQIRLKIQEEETSVFAFNLAKEKRDNLLNNLPSNSQNLDVQEMIVQLQDIINQLEEVKSGTTVYKEAQNMKLSAQNKIKELRKS